MLARYKKGIVIYRKQVYLGEPRKTPYLSEYDSVLESNMHCYSTYIAQCSVLS